MEATLADDVGLRRTISHFCHNGRRILSKEAWEISEKWRWKGLVAFYLIVAEILEQKKVQFANH